MDCGVSNKGVTKLARFYQNNEKEKFLIFKLDFAKFKLSNSISMIIFFPGFNWFSKIVPNIALQSTKKYF